MNVDEKALMNFHDIAHRLVRLPRLVKQLTQVVVDACLSSIAVWIAYFVRLNEWTPLSGEAIYAVAGSLVLAIPIFILMGVYRPMFRYAESASANHLVAPLLLYALAYSVVFTVWSIPGVPRTIGIIQPALLFIFMALVRIGARAVLHGALNSRGKAAVPRVLIYGAGVSGRQLAAAITSRREMRVMGFLDDNRELQGASINGIRVHSPQGWQRCSGRWRSMKYCWRFPRPHSAVETRLLQPCARRA
ncbi:hypothetical protein PIB19_22330 [Sphingomonas sp. 7/4-4]|uniref:nucleoside-diphosphate sugar epimerase/dehydratase n=1 Tax=Sphingomonas sp. 7/4-4 TaxID=3018446 RepID=UPI0022F3FB4E|nr:hypothetical protein [Sphingomonas sp. 7/4-4]WBY07946.1 hypothetical protein PIB19_22330 [Sphingomonas sp. 7/4-4]